MIAITQQRYWSSDEDKAIVDMLKNGVGIREIGNRLQRSEKAVRNRCGRLHIDVCATRQKYNVKSFAEADVKCPFFYAFSKGKSVKCEGITKGSYVLLGFIDEERWMEHVRSCCNDGYRSCKLYGMLDGAYASELN